MSKNKQDKKDNGKKEHVQRVLDYHNKKYGTHIKIYGKTQDIHPDLKGKSDWDWVCYDNETDEVAVECKSLRDQLLSEKGKITWQFLEKVRDRLLGKLPGTYHLFPSIPNGYYLPLRGQQDKTELLDLLCTIINRTAKKLQVGEEADLKRESKLLLQIKKKKGGKLYIPDTFLFNLRKISNTGSLLTFGFGQSHWQSRDFDNTELNEFRRLVSDANTQLQKANVKDTFLVLIEVHSAKEPQVIAEALRRINPNSYSEIKYVYFTGYGEVAEIPLPTPSPAP
jgi:hypothetical protein